MRESARDVVLRLVALPRQAGTPAAARAREILVEHLRGLGYEVRIQRFTFHPRSLDAFPLFGVGLGGLALAILPALVLAGVTAWAALAMWIFGLVALLAVTVGIGAGWAALGGVAEDANLIAVRPGAPVRRWVVAHADTKAQGHSMAGRLVSVWAVVAALAIVTTVAALRIAGPVAPSIGAGAALLAVLAGALATRGRLRGTSPGACDNATGLLAALVAAEGTAAGLGVLITGAEEFGLVGARILARLGAAAIGGTEVINIDSVDDAGTMFVVSHDAAARPLAARVAAALAWPGGVVRPRRLPAGILVDSLPLARTGAVAVTIGRLTWATLRRIHTPSDTPDALTWETAERVGRTIAALN